MDKKPRIFKIKDILEKKNFWFVGDFEEIKGIINKINKDGISSINKSEKDILNKYISVSQIDNNTVLVRALINIDDTIDIIKKKIMVYIGKKHTSIYLWINKTKIDEYETTMINKLYNTKSMCEKKILKCDGTMVKGYGEILGFGYYDRDFKKIISCDITQEITTQPDFTYTLTDQSHLLLQHYGNIKDDTINLIEYDTFKDKYPEKTTEEFTDFYFPFIKRSSVSYENYDTIVKGMVLFDNKYHNNLLDLELIETNPTYKNIVFSSKQVDIDILKFFNRIELDETVCFCKYRSRKRSELYKLFHKSIGDQIISEDFRNPDNYIVKYKADLYSFPIDKQTLQKWTQSEISIKEKYLLKIEQELNLLEKKEDEISIKIRYKEYYLDLTIFRKRIVFRYLGISIDKTEIKKMILFVNKTIEKINEELGIGIILLKETDYITLDYSDRITDSKLKLKKLSNNIDNYSGYVYRIVSDNPDENTIHLKYKRVNHFTSFENIRRYFIKIKKDNKLSVSNFNKAWITETQKLFHLSERDSLEILTIINESMDTDELKKRPMDIDIDVILSRTINEKKETLYNISVLNCDNLDMLDNIRKFIAVLFYDSKKNTIKKVIPEQITFDIRETKITNEDEFDFDNNFIDLEDLEALEDLEDLEDLEPIQQNINLQQDIDNNSNTENIPSDVKLKKMSVRNYMSVMRKKDNKLFNFKSKELKPYTKSCGASDMRQPIILTRDELLNFEKKNPSAFKLITKLDWGSSAQSKNFYICPRIWCIRDKISLTDEQLIDNDGICPFCDGEIIDSQSKQIQDNKTIIIRRGGANNFWANSKIKKSEKWKKFLENTEKDAFPGLLSPKLHSKGFCMPCCNKNENWNYSKCMITEVDYTFKQPIDPKKLVDGVEIENEVLTEGDLILLKNTKENKKNNIYIITDDGAKIYDKLTKINIPLQVGFSIKIMKGDMKGYIYETDVLNGHFIFKEKPNTGLQVDKKYILGEDKFPLESGQMGTLYTKIDNILNHNSSKFIVNSRLTDGSTLFIRMGIKQNPNTSFLDAIARIGKITVTQLVKNIIENITPFDFIGSNSGDLLKMFSLNDDELDIQMTEENNLIFISWCMDYIDFFYFYKKEKRITNAKSLNTQIEELRKKKKYRMLFGIFYAFENFKKYCGDFNIIKDPIHFIDILSRKNEWFFKNGLNIIIFEKKLVHKELLYIKCPFSEDINSLIDKQRSICFLYKYKNRYEPIIVANTKSDYYSPNFTEVLNDEKRQKLNEKIVNKAFNIYNIVKNNCDNLKYDMRSITDIYNINYKTLPSIKNITTKIQTFVTDEYYKGIGALLTNNTIVFTLPFGIKENTSSKKISEIEFKPYEDTIIHLKGKATSIILKNKNIVAIVLEDGNFHPVKTEKYNSKQHTLPVIDFNYEIDLSLEHINNSNSFIQKFKDSQNAYNNLKNELKFMFSLKNKNTEEIKEIIYGILKNSSIKQKREDIRDIIRYIVESLTTDFTVKTKKNTQICSKLKETSCNTNKLCRYGKKPNTSMKKYNFSSSFYKCKLKLPKLIKNNFILKLTEEIIFSLKERYDILEGNIILETIQKNNTIVSGEDYIGYIKNLFDNRNKYLKNKVTKSMRNIEITSEFIHPLKKLDVEQIEQDIEESNNTFRDIDAIKYTKRGKEVKNKKIKEGKCIFPFKMNINGELFTDCIDDKNIENGKMCATEIDRDRVMTKYAFCSDNTCNSDIITSDTDSFGVKDTDPSVKPGPCCTPFKNKKKINKIISVKDHDKCIEHQQGRGMICATSVYAEDIPHKTKIKSRVKGQLKTYGYCPQKTNTIYTKKNKKCLLPFKFKGSFYNKCVDHKKGRICPIKFTKEGRLNLLGKKDIDYGYCKDTGSIDKTKWNHIPGVYLHSGKGSIHKTKLNQKFRTVDEAITRCEKEKECLGITENLKNNKITMRKTTNPKKDPTQNSWVQI